MIAIPCSNCNRMIDLLVSNIEIDEQVEPIKVTCYLLLCKECQIDAKNRERDIKLNNILSSKRGLKERIKQWWNDVNIVNFVNSVL